MSKRKTTDLGDRLGQMFKEREKPQPTSGFCLEAWWNGNLASRKEIVIEGTLFASYNKILK